MTPSAAVRIGTLLQPAGLEPLGATCVLDGRTQPPLAEEAHREPRLGTSVSVERQREEHTRAVPGHAVGRPRSAMPDGSEAGERAVEQLARCAPVEIRDEADPQALRSRRGS